MKKTTKRNITLLFFAVVGSIFSYFLGYEPDPLRPYLVLLLFLIVAKLNLEYFLGLKMSFTYVFAHPNQFSERKRLLFTSWLLALLGVYFIIFEF